jgi:hypothetical protein
MKAVLLTLSVPLAALKPLKASADHSYENQRKKFSSLPQIPSANDSNN